MKNRFIPSKIRVHIWFQSPASFNFFFVFQFLMFLPKTFDSSEGDLKEFLWGEMVDGS